MSNNKKNIDKDKKTESKKTKVSNESSSKRKDDKKHIIPFKYIKYLLLTEKAIDNISTRNTLVFIVDERSKKENIRKEVEKIFKVKVNKVNTLIDRKGRKKAYVSLSSGHSAEEVATQLGMM